MRRGTANVGSGSMKRRMVRDGASGKIISANPGHDILNAEKDPRSGLDAGAVRERCTPSSQEDHEMAALTGIKAKTTGLVSEEPGLEFFGQRKKPENGQFRLQVDRQTKASYATFDAAEKAGLAIKKAYPILQVVVHDAVEGVHKAIELANT